MEHGPARQSAEPASKAVVGCRLTMGRSRGVSWIFPIPEEDECPDISRLWILDQRQPPKEKLRAPEAGNCAQPDAGRSQVRFRGWVAVPTHGGGFNGKPTPLWLFSFFPSIKAPHRPLPLSIDTIFPRGPAFTCAWRLFGSSRCARPPCLCK